MAWTFYKNFKKGQLDGAATHGEYPVDFDTDQLGVLLLTASYTADQSDVDLADLTLSTNEVSGTNYARKAISSVTATLDGNNVDVDSPTDLTYAQSSSGFSNAKHAILFKSNTSSIGSLTAASSPLIAYNTFTSSIGNTAGALTIQFHASGIFTLS